MAPRRQGIQAAKEAEREAQALRLWIRSFHPYQREFIFDESLISLWVKARQIGFSHAIAASAVKDALTEHSTNIILSASQELSSEVLDKAKAHCRVLAEAGLKAAKPKRENASRIVLPNGGRVIALPANPRTARSFTGNVYFDEAAYHADFKGIWDAAAAMKTRKAVNAKRKIRIVSTPNGAQGLFYDWVTNPPKGWRTGEIKIEKAMAQGMRVDLNELWQLAGHDERVFAQWYRCAFLDAALQYIPTAMVERAMAWKGLVPDLSACDIYAGLDIGRTKDLTVLSIVAVFQNVAWVVAQMTCPRTRFRAQRKMIDEAREAFGWLQLHIDATGLGMDLAEELVEDYGVGEIVPVHFSADVKADLVTRVLRWMRDNRLRYPKVGPNAEELKKDSVALRRIISPSGNVLYDIPETSRGHGDRFWAMALALKGAGDPVFEIGYGEEPLLAAA